MLLRLEYFLNLTGYYRMFMMEFSTKTYFVTNVSRKTIKFEYTEKCEKEF